MAEILGADLGWVILAGIVVGLPVALVVGIFFGKWAAQKFQIVAPAASLETIDSSRFPSPIGVFALIFVPIFLILLQTTVKSGLLPLPENTALRLVVDLLGSPFVALLVANLLAWYFLGLRRGVPSSELLDITSRSLAPAGTIILVTGAGGVFKQILVETGAGKMLADQLSGHGIPIFLLAFLTAAAIRLLQGSATVAMITAAGIVAPILTGQTFHPFQLATVVIAIAAGATTTSHVNDSGFWMVKQYLGLTEKETFRTWTTLTTLLAIGGILMVAAIWAMFF